jgi:nucleoside-diphosphate-sugar epimerase
MKRALVCGGGGFIGSHIIKRLKREGFWVRAVDLKGPQYSHTAADDFVVGDLRDQMLCRAILDADFDEVYQLAADMGGAEYIFTGRHDAEIMINSATINVNVLASCRQRNIGSLFYSSSACIYPLFNQTAADNPVCREDSAYPAEPDSEYGWEKLFAERLFLAHQRNHGMNVHVARYHNVFGPEGPWDGGKEKAPAAICRKVALAKHGEAIQVLGDGTQTRSFLYIEDCVEGTTRLARSSFEGPVNIGSEHMVTIDGLVDLVADIAGKKIEKRHVAGPVGVRGRNSDNRLIRQKLNWEPCWELRRGLERTYAWIEQQVRKSSGTGHSGLVRSPTSETAAG